MPMTPRKPVAVTVASPSSNMASESSPLLPSQQPTKSPRNVTFNPHVSTSSPSGSAPLRPSAHLPVSPAGHKHNGGQLMLSAINSKLRRRNSQGAPLNPPSLAAPKIGPQRTTRNVQKLKLLPNPEQADETIDDESSRDVYAQLTRIKEPTARRDAARLGKADRERLPRVTAYCTASSYQMDALLRFLKSKTTTRGAAPKLFDECIYTPYDYSFGKKSAGGEDGRVSDRRHSDGAVILDGLYSSAGGDQGSLQAEGVDASLSTCDLIDFDTNVHTPEVFLFNYGTVVIWGMTSPQEDRFLKEMDRFENEKLAKDDVQTEDFNFYYTHEYQARIYNDFISLRDKKNYMTKLAISHALAQSVKTSLYEDLVDNTIDTTKDIPSQIATTGKVSLSRREINMQIGELFILRINIHLQGSVLDSPELMWAEPHLEPIYQAVRSYLEMDQRVSLLTERLDVIADLLAVLKDQLTVTHSELLEWVVIVLVAAEVVVAAVNIVVDLYAGVG